MRIKKYGAWMNNAHVEQQLVFLQVIVSIYLFVNIFFYVFSVCKFQLLNLLIYVYVFLCIFHGVFKLF